MTLFTKNILLLGCGGVAQCALPLIIKHIDIAPSCITVMDFVDNQARIAQEIQKGVRYEQKKITQENYREVLSQHLKKGDLFIDLSFGVCSFALIKWCHDHGVLYLNTSVELWNTPDSFTQNLQSLTLYSRQIALQELVQSWGNLGPTAVINHGANPGLVSHLVKQGLMDLGNHFLKEKPSSSLRAKIQKALQEEDFPRLACLLQVKTIHISEKDTQISAKQKSPEEFVNTWSVAGFIEEGLAPAEIGWGTHEKHLPKQGLTYKNNSHNQIYLSQKGIETLVQSWVPSGPIEGMVIRHAESFSISNHLTIWGNDKVIYRPTVHYAYCPCEGARESLKELQKRNFIPQPKSRILSDELISGKDELGCLLMGHDFNAWWIGSVLSLEESRQKVPHQSATTLQVAISVIAAALFIIKHPERGLCEPDDLSYKEILEVSIPYLGKIVSKPVNWSPSIHLSETENAEQKWQFTSFLLEKTEKPLPEKKEFV